MILSVSTWSAHPLLESGELSMEGFVELIGKMGAQGMEVVEIDFKDTSYENMRKLQELGENNGVQITCMSLEHDLCRTSADLRCQDIEKVKAWIDMSVRLGVPLVRVFTGWKKENIPYDTQMQWVYEGLREISDYAAVKNIKLALENHNDVCLRAGEILELQKKINNPYLRTCPDIFNYKKFTGPQQPLIDDECFEEIEYLLPMAANAHIKICEAVNGNTKERYLDIERMIKRLAANDYHGALTIEFMWPYMDKNKNLINELENAIALLDYQMKKTGVKDDE